MTVSNTRTFNNAKDVNRKYGTSAIADDAVTAPKIAPSAVLAADIPDLSILTAKLAAGAVTKAKTAMFISAEQTGTGASQNVAHGLGVIPTAVFVAPTDLTPATVGQYVVTEGVHDATNVKVTVTTSKKYKVMAWA